MGSAAISTPVNLNLLPLLRALLKDRSVTRAARNLGVTQSAASQGLGRLREMLGDPLLVRIGGRMQLTPRAKELMSRVEAVSSELNDIFLSDQFDPGKAKRAFVIAANDYMAYMVARPMLDLVYAEAPGIQLQFVEMGIDFPERMAAHEIDFALLPRFAVRDYIAAPLRYRTLYREVVGLLMDRTHPLTTRTTVSKADLAPFKQITYWSEALERGLSGHRKTPVEVAALGHSARNVVLRTSHMSLLPILLQGTDLVTVVPHSIGVELSRVWPLELRKMSFGPQEVDDGIVWSPVFDADPVHSWFRRRIEEIMTRRERAL